MKFEGKSSSKGIRSKMEVEVAEEAEVDEEEEIEVGEVEEAEVVEEVRTTPGKYMRRKYMCLSRKAAKLHLKRGLRTSWVISLILSKQNSIRISSRVTSFILVISFTKCTS